MHSAAALAACLCLTGGAHHGYGWPLKPFDRQHAIRGGFGDPRFGVVQRNFHFGIDIPAAGGTPVYAVAAGRAYLEQDHVDVLTDGSPRHSTGFAYWHIVAAVREHAPIRVHELVGWVKPYWQHLHFAEIWNGRWLNPLRPGALTPYRDRERPAIGPVTIERGRRGIDLVVAASVRPARPLAQPWSLARFAPTLIRWRAFRGDRIVSGWRTAVDFRTVLPPNRDYRDMYTPWTRPNLEWQRGRYGFYLARGWIRRPGVYRIEARAYGPRGASATRWSTVVVGLG